MEWNSSAILSHHGDPDLAVVTFSRAYLTDVRENVSVYLSDSVAITLYPCRDFHGFQQSSAVQLWI
jgi:hypothetical protein